MKKILVTLVVVAMGLVFVSCDKQCDCKTTVTDSNGNKVESSSSVDLEKVYGSDTKKKCKDLNSNTEVGGTKTVVKCH